MLVRIVMGTHSQRFLGKVFGITKTPFTRFRAAAGLLRSPC